MIRLAVVCCDEIDGITQECQRHPDFAQMESTFADLSINSDEGIKFQLEEDDDNGFHHILDVNRILEGSPWSFNNHPLVLHSLQIGDHPLRVPLNKIPFWVQVYDLPHGYFTERVGKQLGDYISKFLEYDGSNRGAARMTFIRIRVEIDTCIPLKRWKKVGHRARSFLVHLKYETLNSFCFVCGLLGHTENFCEIRFTSPGVIPKMEWGIFLKAPERRGNMGESSRWLRGAGLRTAAQTGLEAIRHGVVAGPIVSVGRNSPGYDSMQTNPIFEDENRINVLELEDSTADEERKRKRGKMIMANSLGNNCMELQALNSVENSMNIDISNVTAGLGYGACREL
ncbi:hypothetical protein ACS0TY_017900 [Phlomoides rotata]